MRLPEAKQYVADKLEVGVIDLTDSTIMRELRDELDIGVVTGVPGARKGIEAKRNRRPARRRDQLRQAAVADAGGT